ncbi:MAG: hypothetical protein OXB98_02200 [Bryobacterales bacterium]|nr:hypothetical protein [Bryobacterales bacterium]
MRVLIIPEDFRKDQYVLKPIFQRLFRQLGRPTAKIVVCQDPLLGGIGEALKEERLTEIVRRYEGMTDIFLLCVDRDGETGRRARLDAIEAVFGADRTFLAENAWEELETWVLAGLELPNQWMWADVRAEIAVKDVYFNALVDQRGISRRPGGGRKTLGEEAARRIGAIRQKCPEDFDSLAKRIGDSL